MRVIHAWVLENPMGTSTFEAEVELPKGVELLGVRFSTSGLQLYGIADILNLEENGSEMRRFLVTGHGHRDRIGEEVPTGVSAIHYIGTADLLGGPTAHVFDVTNVTADV